MQQLKNIPISPSSVYTRLTSLVLLFINHTVICKHADLTEDFFVLKKVDLCVVCVNSGGGEKEKERED